MTQPNKKPNKDLQEPEPLPGVEVGDHLYVHHQGQPCTGCVVAHGRHGVTVKISGERHKIKWDKVLGHKQRVAIEGEVVDQGEDGMIVQEKTGRKRFIGVPNEAKEDPLMVKAIDPLRPVLLLFKGGPIANRPGLIQKEITDKQGVVSKRWVRSNKDQPKGREKKAGAEAGAEAGYGTHNLGPGDKITFKAGDFEGSGTIVGKPGAGGAHVKDSSGREHKVRWAEITGHDKNGTDKPEVKHEVQGSQGPVHPDKFQAADYAKEHDDPEVTPESILANFPPDTAGKIAAVQERLKAIEQTIDQHKKGDSYQGARQAVHRRIFAHLMSPERIAAAVPQNGEQPKLILLGGRGGSGKSWFEGQVYDPSKVIKLDADEIKGMLPEYEGWNAAQVHEESSDIMNTVLTTARKLGLNVVLDGTLATKKSALQKIDAFKADGYSLEAHYMHLPRQEAAKRAVQRFLGKTNRYVPVDVVLANRDNEANFDEVRKHADKWSFRDNNVPQGQPPKLISESGGAAAAEGPEALNEDSDHANPPKVGAAFKVYRAGHADERSLAGRNAGDANAVGLHLARTDDFDSPQSKGGAPTHLHAYKVTPKKDFGKYQLLNNGADAQAGAGDGSIGRGKFGSGVAHSFPTDADAFEEEHLGSVPLDELRAKMKERHGDYDNFGDHGGNRVGEAIRAHKFKPVKKST